MLNHKTLPPSGPLSYLHGSALKTWTSYWKREGSAGMDTRNAPTAQSRQPLTYRLMEAWAWEAQDDLEAADREGSQRVEALSY